MDDMNKRVGLVELFRIDGELMNEVALLQRFRDQAPAILRSELLQMEARRVALREEVHQLIEALKVTLPKDAQPYRRAPDGDGDDTGTAERG